MLICNHTISLCERKKIATSNKINQNKETTLKNKKYRYVLNKSSFLLSLGHPCIVDLSLLIIY